MKDQTTEHSLYGGPHTIKPRNPKQLGGREERPFNQKRWRKKKLVRKALKDKANNGRRRKREVGAGGGQPSLNIHVSSLDRSAAWGFDGGLPR